MHSWLPILRRTGLGLSVLGLVTAAHAQTLGNPATAPQNSTACCQLTTSLVNDVLRGHDVSGDERFFSAEGAPPNIHFLVDTSGSMRELPQVENSDHIAFFNITVNGCENPRLDAFAAARSWNPATVYPVPDTGTGEGSDNGFPNLFQDDKFYGYLYWADLSNPASQWDTKEQACQSQVPDWSTTGAAEYTRCQTCLSSKGYYKVPGVNGRNTPPLENLGFMFWGRFLNFNPPKYVTAKAVLKAVIKDLRRVRAGISYFTNSAPNTVLMRGQNPSCQQIINDASSFDSNRASYINAINGLTFTSGTPLARSLLNIGYYFSSDDLVYRNNFGFGTGYSYPSAFRNPSLSAQGRSVCWGCQVSSVIIVTDGEPTSDSLSSTVVTKLRTLNGGPVYCSDTTPCGPNALPPNGRDKGNDAAVYTDDNQNYMLDDVAKMLYEQDLQRNTPPIVGDFNTAGKQNVLTYTVGFGINSPFLRHTAEVGGGLYYTADDADTLKQALLSIITNVQTRATSFSSPAASTLQVRSASATMIPRFKPARSQTAPWQGFLYRFREAKERLMGCNPQNPSAGGDLNQDGDCNDTLLIDSSGKAIIENDEGNFIRLLDSQLGITTAATPFWEAGAKLKPDPNAVTQKWMERKIYTIIDSNHDGKVDFRDTPVPFDVAHAEELREYLGISQNAAECADLAGSLGIPPADLGPTACAELVIKYYRGADVLNPDPSERSQDRPFLLHDIFHSSPVTVDPPVPSRFCTFFPQCTTSLFTGSTPQTTNDPNTNGKAYDLYQQAKEDRDKIVLVGSNGGMLHAFHNGQATSDPADPLTGQRQYDDGTGEELWAFIPPDLLPKLRPNLGKHAYFVDGTPMLRDVWMDSVGGAADGKKQPGEYRTVAIVGTGRGGVHRFALDLTRLLGSNPGEGASAVPDQAGDFLWMWPQPCDPLALQVGESFSNFAPRAPPIVPVALSPAADDALRVISGGTAGGAVTPWNVAAPNDARERWVVALNGGYDEHMLQGRGFAFVDVRSGHTVWSYFYGDTAGSPRSEHLKYPIGAGLAMMDIGQATNSPADIDQLFDTATVGDYGGQLWTVRMWTPGQWDATRKQVNNWFAARAFRVANPQGPTGPADAMRPPFAYTTVNALQPNGRIRTFLGTGDRENMLDKGTTCRLSNPRACAVQGCGVNNTLTVERGTPSTYTTAFTANATYDDRRYASGTSISNTTVGAPGAACGGARVTLSWNNTVDNGCLNGNDGSLQYTCEGDSSTWKCQTTQDTWTALNYNQATTPYPQRYYGLWTYGDSPARKFNTNDEANVYESGMLTDASLVNVSNFQAGTIGDPNAGRVTSTPSAPTDGPGWYIHYAATNERTGTSGTLISGCVLWSSFEPSGASGAVCSTTGTNIARLYQANFATGEANCALSFYSAGSEQWNRYKLTTTVASPAEPALQVGIGGGIVTIDANQQGPGQQDTTQVQKTDEGVKSLYQIELDRRGHNCRHNGDLTSCD